MFLCIYRYVCIYIHTHTLTLTFQTAKTWNSWLETFKVFKT